MNNPQRKVLFGIMFFLMIIVTACGPVHKSVRPTTENINKIKSLALIVPTEPNFTVIYDRAKATNAAALFFGLLGAAVASAHNEALDNKKAELISSYLDKVSCRSIFLESLHKALNSAGRFTEIKIFDKELESRNIFQDAVVTFRIQNWGIRLADRERDHMSAFIELEIKMIQTQNNQVLWDEHEVVLGQGRHPFGSYQKNKELLQSDLKVTCEEAGSRMANILIYQ